MSETVQITLVVVVAVVAIVAIVFGPRVSFRVRGAKVDLNAPSSTEQDEVVKGKRLVR
jgi:hypothetical protein